METLKDIIDEYTQNFEEMAANQAPCGGFDFRDLVEDLAVKVWNGAIMYVFDEVIRNPLQARDDCAEGGQTPDFSGEVTFDDDAKRALGEIFDIDFTPKEE